MAITSPMPNVQTPDIRAIVTPVLYTLPGAAVSTEPAPTILPILSPILRQRVQLLSSASTEPWIRLLTYDTAKVPKLVQIAQSGSLEPHPASGEIELDWDYDIFTRYRRIDKETLQTFVLLKELGLFVRLVYCTDDKEGGGDGWRVGEVGVADGLFSLTLFGGFSSLAEAEESFAEESAGIRQADAVSSSSANTASNRPPYSDNVGGDEKEEEEEEEEEEDDDYWARYDATPARTPAVKRSPAPASIRTTTADRSASAEDDYYAQYDSVQPAMDNHDPDEEAEQQAQHIQAVPPLGLGRAATTWQDGPEGAELNETSGAWTMADAPPRSPSQEDEERTASLAHPRPASSASSSGSRTVARLEETAERRDQAEFGIKQHVARTIRSLYLLSRASGMDREEFETMVRAELDVLGVVDGET